MQLFYSYLTKDTVSGTMFTVITISIVIFIKIVSILTKGRCRSNICLIGKTALITGGNSGIGLEAAKALAARGCRIIIADVVDATKSKDEIIKETNNPNIIIKHCDFASFKSVRELAKDINATEERLDILINNAGIGSKRMVVTEDKLPRALQVNYFSHFLLTHLLIDLLKKSKPSRILFNISISAYVITKFEIKDLSRVTANKNGYEIGPGAYGIAKKLMVYATESFAEKLRNYGITVNCFHPGLVPTEIFQKTFEDDGNYFAKVMEFVAILLGKSPEEGIQTLLYLAIDKKVENVSGKVFFECINFFKPPAMKDKLFRQEVWSISEKLVELEECEKIK